MFESVETAVARLAELERALCAPEAAADPKRFAALMREVKRLRPIADAFSAYRAAEADRDAAQALAKESGADRALHELLAQEQAAAEARCAELSQRLRVLLLPRDENDDKNVVMEIRAGAGGDEAALFAARLFRMYTMYAQAHSWGLEVVSASETQLGGLKEISFLVEGEGAYSRLKFESGVHRVQRVPETESGGRIHTSTATVAVLPEAEEVDFALDPADLQIDVFRSSGAGGQKVNKTSSAIRVTHLPTGMVVECQDERSQYRNKDKALAVLRARLYEIERKKQEAEIAGERRAQVGTGDRSERIRTYNFPQGRVTDHRIGLTLYKLEAVLDGDLDEILDALLAADAARKLEAAGAEK
ncbi:MAG TPA: peptide chain release factor 1 [Candidatus Fimenecus excrementigallinarum]|uniref:Peptide chain release factor 1 n=1 Tax=Candidatus Fimenecus excrementigallinarum TaxID=2840816 RepID=A0A9D1IDS8_9FIRM|nr:peptide chain release factor 1 [Candidatus Fimenecus excrementigallinarum]